MSEVEPGSDMNADEHPADEHPAAENPQHPDSGRRFAVSRLSLAVAVFVLVLDQATKYWALHTLIDRDEQHVIWTLQWNLTYNSGMAFSRGRGLGPVIGVVAMVVVVVLVFGSAKLERRLARVAAGMLLGGAVGNLCDRLFRGTGLLNGAVIDFIDVQWWPIFNVADVGVTVGGALFVLASLRSPRSGVGHGVQPVGSQGGVS